MDSDHDARIRAAFTRQAETFEDERLNVAFTVGLPWLLRYVAADPADTVLDVAAGTGIVSRAIAPDARRVIALDATPAMVAEGTRRAGLSGLANVRFVLGSAESLPFPAASFSLVVTRFSLHHFADPAPMLDEMVRVLRPGGRLVVKDLVASTDPELAARQDRVERLRDDSHVRMPPRGAVASWLGVRGLRVSEVAEQEIDRPVRPWLEQAVAGPQATAQVLAAFEADLAGGEPTGLRPHLLDGEPWFRQTWEVTVAAKPV